MSAIRHEKQHSGEPVNILQVLQDAINGMTRYPGELEELALQLHNVTSAAQELAKHYDLPIQEDGIVAAP